IGGNDGVALLDGEDIAQPRRFRTSLFETGKFNRGELILLAWVGGENDAQLIASILGARFNRSVVIALGSEQFLQQFGVRRGPAPDLRGVGGTLALLLQRGSLAKGGEQVFGSTD